MCKGMHFFFPFALALLDFFLPFSCLQIRKFGSLSLLFWLKKRLARKLFGSVGKALTFREELETRKRFGSVGEAPTFGEELILTRGTLGFIWFACCCSF